MRQLTLLILVISFGTYTYATEFPLKRIANDSSNYYGRTGLWYETDSANQYFGSYLKDKKTGIWLVFSENYLIEQRFYIEDSMVCSVINEEGELTRGAHEIYQVQNSFLQSYYQELPILVRIIGYYDNFEHIQLFVFTFSYNESTKAYIVINNSEVIATFITNNNLIDGDLFLYDKNFLKYKISYNNGFCSEAFAYNKKGKEFGHIFYTDGDILFWENLSKFKTLVKINFNQGKIRLNNNKTYVILPYMNGCLLPTDLFKSYYGVCLQGDFSAYSIKPSNWINYPTSDN